MGLTILIILLLLLFGGINQGWGPTPNGGVGLLLLIILILILAGHVPIWFYGESYVDNWSCSPDSICSSIMVSTYSRK